MESKISINSDFNSFMKVFLEENSKRNLISKNDEKFLFEKHIYDSLSIKLFFEKYKIKEAEILDIGCGGGFPSIPIAIEFPEFSVIGLDSIRKKILAVQEIKDKLGVHNLGLICDRVENIKDKKFSIIVSRAVADLTKISGYALPILKKNGFFIAYKSRKTNEEIESAKSVLKKYNADIVDVISYSLPLDDLYERNLIVIKKS